MVKIFTIAVFTFFVLTFGYSQQTKRVAFLGNSYTAANDLPLMISKLAHSAGDELNYTSSTPGGYTFQSHSTNSGSTSLLQQTGLDYVVLQEQSQLPSFPNSQVATDVFPYAEDLCNMITQYNPCAKPLFFMTWGRKYGDSQNCSVWPPVCTYEGMDSLLNLRYRQMADSNEAYVSPVGAVWHYIRDMDSTIELYSSDYSHPSLAGSYAAACTFYTLIFQKDPSLIADDYNVDPVIAQQIRAAAKVVAFDSLQKWNVGKFIPEANFSINQNGNAIQIVNQSLYANSYHWEYGDGDTSNLFEPNHVYTQNGTYQLKLIASKCNKTDTFIDTVIVNTASVSISEDFNVKIFPNPTKDKINLELNKKHHIDNIAVYSVEGKEVIRIQNINQSQIQININGLERGLYFIAIKIDTKTYRYKFVVN